MKIGMILDKEFYGDMRVENEVQALSESGFQVYVYAFTFNGKHGRERFNGATVVNISVSYKLIRKLRALTNTIFNVYPYFIQNLIKKHIYEDQIDILHIHDLYLFQVGLNLKRRFPHLILVGDLHENYVEGLKHYKFANSFPGNLLISIPKWEQKEIKWCMQYDHLITVIEEAVERYSSLGITKDKISVVANYVNQNEFLNDEFDENIIKNLDATFNITYIGGFDVHRGLESAVKAMPMIVKEVKDARLILVGKGKNESGLKKLASDLGVKENVLFEGFQPVSKLPSYIKGSDICLIPHLKTVHTDNTIPHKLFHYMILGKPVITSDCNPLKRIVNEVNCGLVYPSNNEKILATNIIKLIKNEELITNYGKNGLAAVKEKYNWTETSKTLIKLYQRIYDQQK